MKPKNLKEFKALIERYETITLEEIKKTGNIYNAAFKLTGFNSVNCSLCKPIRSNCFLCVYCDKVEHGCLEGKNGETFDRIYFADTPTKLLNAFRARAKHMKTLLK